MSFPVQLSDLDLASTADDADLALIRKNNTTDYKCTVQAMRDINIPGLPSLSGSAAANDPMIISQSGTNCQIPFGQVGFVAGTKIWFYQGLAPTYWQVVPNTGDRLLAVRGGATYVTGGSVAGTWQQTDVDGVAGKGLTIAQMPLHGHGVQVRDDTGFSSNDFVRSAKASGSSSKTIPGPIVQAGSNSGTDGTSAGHNHGSGWRPDCAVGIICQKTI